MMFANFYGVDEIIEASGREHQEEIIEILRHHGFDEIDAHVHIINMMMLVVAKKTG